MPRKDTSTAQSASSHAADVEGVHGAKPTECVRRFTDKSQALGRGWPTTSVRRWLRLAREHPQCDVDAARRPAGVPGLRPRRVAARRSLSLRGGAVVHRGCATYDCAGAASRSCGCSVGHARAAPRDADAGGRPAARGRACGPRRGGCGGCMRGCGPSPRAAIAVVRGPVTGGSLGSPTRRCRAGRRSGSSGPPRARRPPRSRHRHATRDAVPRARQPGRHALDGGHRRNSS